MDEQKKSNMFQTSYVTPKPEEEKELGVDDPHNTF